MLLCKVLMMVAWLRVAANAQSNATLEDFVATNMLPDGEMVTRISRRGITAKETTVSSRSDKKITLRQLTDGNHFIQLIYNDHRNVVDCEYLNQRGQIEKFLRKFQEDVDDRLSTLNVTAEPVGSKRDLTWLNFRRLKKQCRRSHAAIRKVLFKRKEDDNAGRHSSRKKRGISDYFQMPGTEWCGKGFSAKRYTHLGGFSRTDKCCRIHDTACPFWIGGFETKYGLFNWRVNTIMHCSCDDRFRACLKMADTSDANLVGKLFFNVVQTKCFVLKPRKICAKRSWWGKCTKKKYIKHAVLRDNLPY